MDTLRKLTVEHLLYALLIACAIALRLVALGNAPLPDREAQWAMQAYQIAEGQNIPVGSQAGYTVFTAILFFFFNATNFLARVIPAFAGVLLVLLPLLLRKMLGVVPALILTAGLMLDPGMVALSRQAGSAMWALGLLLMAFTLWVIRKPAGAGFCLGLALLGGKDIWVGLIGLLAAVGLSWLARRTYLDEERSESTIFMGMDWKKAVMWAFGALVLGGTLLFLVPQGLGGVAAGLVEFIRGWGSGNGVDAGRLLAALAVYHPVPLIFGLIGFFIRSKAWDEKTWFLGFWALTAMILAFVYPGRQVADLAWVAIPLWVLAAQSISEWVKLPEDGKSAGWSLAGVIFVSAVYIYLQLSAIAIRSSGDAVAAGKWGAVIGGIAVLLLAVGFVAWGWKMASVRAGVVIGGLVVLGLFTLSNSLGAGGLKVITVDELWAQEIRLPQVAILQETMQDLSFRNTGVATALDVTVIKLDTPSLRWLLRDYPKVTFTNQVTVDASPSLILTPLEDQPALVSSYTGQDFVWNETIAWDSLPADQWMRWLIFRQAPRSNQKIILWARTDLFPGGN